MNNLIFTIILSALIYVIFKLFQQFEIKTFQAIVMNYFTCSVIGFFATGRDQLQEMLVVVEPALPYAFGLGCLFISVFTFIGYTSQTFGVSIASIADKLSLIIPVVVAFILYQDEITVLKVLGIVLSIIAVLLAVFKKKNKKDKQLTTNWYYPIIVFIGAGLIGTLLKEVQFRFTEINYNTFLIFLFGVAFAVGFLVFLFQLLRGSRQLSVKSLFAGVLLGIPNYFSIYYLMQTLNTPNWESSIVFPVMNIGVVILSSIVGLLLFKEHFSKQNWIGFALSIIAISMLLVENLG